MGNLILPEKTYSIIYADPPWSYYNDTNAKADCTTVKGMRRPPYPVMGSRDIMALPIAKIAAKNAILFIWTTDYHLEKALECMGAWGFIYKTIGFVWAKKNKSGNPVCFMGAYTMKSGVELCLLGTKGSAHPLVKNHSIRALVESKGTRHSQKPPEVKQRIVELLGDIPRIELFAREITPGWDGWGDQYPGNFQMKSSQ